MDKKGIVFVFSFSILVISNTPLQSFAESEWQIYQVTEGEQIFKIPYKIANGEVESMKGILGGGLIINIKSDENNNGKIEIIMPRNLAETVSSNDSILVALVDNQEVNHAQSNYLPCFSNLLINFHGGSKQITIAATYTSGPLPVALVPPVYVTTDKNNYESGEVITVSGCTNLALDDKEIILDVINPKGKTYKTISVVPNIDGSFSTSLVVEGEDEIDGTYIAKATYADQSATSSFAVPEFPAVLFALLVASITIVLFTRLNSQMIR